MAPPASYSLVPAVALLTILALSLLPPNFSMKFFLKRMSGAATISSQLGVRTWIYLRLLTIGYCFESDSGGSLTVLARATAAWSFSSSALLSLSLLDEIVEQPLSSTDGFFYIRFIIEGFCRLVVPTPESRLMLLKGLVGRLL